MLSQPRILRSALPSLSAFSTHLGLSAMPLRAKIQNNMASGTREMSSDSNVIKELPGDEPDDVLFNNLFGVRTIELNRPRKLNSLNGSMIRKIVPRLQEWAKSDMANVIIMKGAGEKALCAGGDVAELAKWNKEGPEGQQRSRDYFGTEYKLDHLIATYSKPYISFMDGITMGGGVGLSVHAPIRIATERTTFAMPETTIGFFPEVGGSFFLPRLDGALGTYLALTSEYLNGVNAFFHGIATHYIHSSSLPDLENRLAELRFKDYATLEDRLKIINSTIEEFVTGLPHDVPLVLTGESRKAIDKCFSHSDIQQILDSLRSMDTAWSRKTIETMAKRSPTSLKVTLRQMQLGKSWSINQAFEREYNIASHFMAHHDFVEGVSARLINKPPTEPKWQPATLEELNDEAVDTFFRNPVGERKLQLLTSGPQSSYNKYPHAWCGLPTEEEVQDEVKKGNKSRKDVLEAFLSAKDGKMGTKEKVDEILSRKTTRENGVLSWVA